MASASHLPPVGLKISTSYPASLNAKYGCVSSDHQKPTGQPVVVEVAGLEITTAIRLGLFLLTTFGSLRLMSLLLCRGPGRTRARPPPRPQRAFAGPDGTRCLPLARVAARVDRQDSPRDARRPHASASAGRPGPLAPAVTWPSPPGRPARRLPAPEFRRGAVRTRCGAG